MSAVIGLIGVLVGVTIASAYSFWAVRRSELERAVVAGSIMDDELRALREGLAAMTRTRRREPVSAEDAATAWREHRVSLVIYLPPDEFQAVSAAIRRADAWVRDGLQRVTDDLTVDDAGSAESVAKELEGVRLMISGHTARLRSEHQAFILTPLFKYLRRRPWSRRYRAAAP